MKIYLGLKQNNREVFKSATTPTQESHGHLYNAIVGPFRTMRGAKFMRDHGARNPHVQNVADAERIAKQLENQS
jgi:hypothetical protein